MEVADIASGIEPTEVYEAGHALTQSVLAGNLRAVARLLRLGNSTNRPVRLPDGRLVPLLYLASDLGHREVVSLLLDHNAAIDARDNLAGASALFLVCNNNQLPVVLLLLDRGATAQAMEVPHSSQPRNLVICQLLACCSNGLPMWMLQWILEAPPSPPLVSTAMNE